LGFFDGGALLILTNGFTKKTQKTPSQEIALAVRRTIASQRRLII
jgi:phage-related protein